MIGHLFLSAASKNKQQELESFALRLENLLFDLIANPPAPPRKKKPRWRSGWQPSRCRKNRRARDVEDEEDNDWERTNFHDHPEVAPPAAEAAREHGEELTEESAANLVPYPTSSANIIMFLLATVTFQASAGQHQHQLADFFGGDDPKQRTAEAELNLTVSITEKGYTLATSGAVLFRGFV